MAPATFSGPSAIYNHKISTGELRPDPNQQAVVEHLQLFYERVRGYENESAGGGGLVSKLFGVFGKSSASTTMQSGKREEIKKFTNSPFGLYLYGGVGCGKTMLMDLFYDTCELDLKSRVHFHEFMHDIHKRIHQVKQAMGVKNFNLNRSQPYDPIAPVASEIGKETSLLCFDEFQVTDIADAMIIKRLFSHLWQNGVIVFATSNRKPDDLYKNGLQRIHFLPFIPLLKANCDVVNMDSIDYRMLKGASTVADRTYFAATDCNTKYEMDRMYEELVSRETSAHEGPQRIEILGRTLNFDKTCGLILDVTFSELCSRPLGAADYLQIARTFSTILLRDVPRLSLGKRSETRRFITLIDTLYDNHTHVIFSAERRLEDMFDTGEMTSEYDKHHTRVLIGDLDIKVGESNEKASLFTGEEELFAFERTRSRMTEMGSAPYWAVKETTAYKLHAAKT